MYNKQVLLLLLLLLLFFNNYHIIITIINISSTVVLVDRCRLINTVNDIWLAISRTSARTLANLHWRCAAELIKFKLASLTFRCLQELSPRYIYSDFIRVADVPSRRRLRSSSTTGLIVWPSRLVTVGDGAFPVAVGAKLMTVWNGLPDELFRCSHNFLSRVNLKRFCFANFILSCAAIGDLVIIDVSNINMNINNINTMVEPR